MDEKGIPAGAVFFILSARIFKPSDSTKNTNISFKQVPKTPPCDTLTCLSSYSDDISHLDVYPHSGYLEIAFSREILA